VKKRVAQRLSARPAWSIPPAKAIDAPRRRVFTLPSFPSLRLPQFRVASWRSVTTLISDNGILAARRLADRAANCAPIFREAVRKLCCVRGLRAPALSLLERRALIAGAVFAALVASPFALVQHSAPAEAQEIALQPARDDGADVAGVAPVPAQLAGIAPGARSRILPIVAIGPATMVVETRDRTGKAVEALPAVPRRLSADFVPAMIDAPAGASSGPNAGVAVPFPRPSAAQDATKALFESSMVVADPSPPPAPSEPALAPAGTGASQPAATPTP